MFRLLAPKHWNPLKALWQWSATVLSTHFSMSGRMSSLRPCPNWATRLSIWTMKKVVRNFELLQKCFCLLGSPSRSRTNACVWKRSWYSMPSDRQWTATSWTARWSHRTSSIRSCMCRGSHASLRQSKSWSRHKPKFEDKFTGQHFFVININFTTGFINSQATWYLRQRAMRKWWTLSCFLSLVLWDSKLEANSTTEWWRCDENAGLKYSFFLSPRALPASELVSTKELKAASNW